MTQANPPTRLPDVARMRERINELEIKAAFQEQTISDLNDELVRHGGRISELEQKMTRLIENFKTARDQSAEVDQRPPHY